MGIHVSFCEIMEYDALYRDHLWSRKMENLINSQSTN